MEIVTEENNLTFIKKFNQGHLKWLNTHESWHSKMAAFSAYERLDNIDYNNLLLLTQRFNIENEYLDFFVIHSNADHFDRTMNSLMKIWMVNAGYVTEAFTFIKSHQIYMWKLLSKAISDYD